MCSLLWVLVNKDVFPCDAYTVLFHIFLCLPSSLLGTGNSFRTSLKIISRETKQRGNIKTVIFDPHQKSTCICIRLQDLCVEKAGGVFGAKYMLISGVEQNHHLPACQNLDLSHGGGVGRKLHLPMEPKENIPCPT